MREKPRQIKFYVGEAVFQRIQKLKDQTNRTTQEIMEVAIDELLEQSRAKSVGDTKVWWVEMPQDEGAMIEIRSSNSRLAYYLPPWIAAIDALPDSTLEALTQLMRDTVKFFSSSRMKPRRSDLGVTKHE